MSAPKNALKHRDTSQTSLGLWLNMMSPIASHITSQSGFDWVLIDFEHGPYDIGKLGDLLNGVAMGAATPVVRIPTNEDWIIKQVLDLGAQSIMVPMVHSKKDAQKAVDAAKYPPEGTRGMGGAVARAADYGAVADYTETANGEIFIIAQIESRKAIENLSDIMAVEGIDAIFIGPADLSADMGYSGRPEAKEVQEAIALVAQKAQEAELPFGTVAFSQAGVKAMHDLGGRFIAIGADVQILREESKKRLMAARALD
ncbi:MAG: HpcH/HpaI aldolase family protein [Halocynthiibacter sp.]